MSQHNSLVATYANHNLARTTLRNLQSAGFDMGNLFVVGNEDDESLSGAAVVRKLSDVGAAQFSCIPRDYIPDYNAELDVDRLLLVAHGTPAEIDHAREVIDSSFPNGWGGDVGCTVHYGCND